MDAHGHGHDHDHSHHSHARERKPIWTSSSFLIYTGGLTVLGAASAGLTYLATTSGPAGMAGWSFLFLAIVYALAHALLMRGRWLAAGILAFVSVILWAVFLQYLFLWFGWDGVRNLTGSFDSWSWSRMLFWLLVLAVASLDRRLFRFPFISAISVVVFYLFVVDLLTSGHGNWFAWVSLGIGLLYLLLGTAIGTPSTFWLHLVGGALIGGALLKWFHTSNFDFALISVFSVAFVLVGYATRRSTWAVYGTIGFFAATTHFAGGSPTALYEHRNLCTALPKLSICGAPPISPWAPALAFGLLGFWLMLLGMLGKPKRRNKHTAVVVEPLAPPAA